jgi:putative ABC transport system substrate-binding protein
MNHKGILFLIAASALICSNLSEAQQPKKVPRIGYLAGSDAATESARSEGVQLALRERGYMEGENIAIEYRYAEGKIDRATELAAELVHLKVDIIVVAGGRDSMAKVRQDDSIVMMGSGSRPGRAC